MLWWWKRLLKRFLLKISKAFMIVKSILERWMSLWGLTLRGNRTWLKYLGFWKKFTLIKILTHFLSGGAIIMLFGRELLPPNTSDGFYKILTMLIAIYLKPPLLIIDEIENSLHPSTLELILNTIKIGETQAILTTHSPVVVDRKGHNIQWRLDLRRPV